MSKMRYLDFDLVIERSEKGYVARVSNSPAGQATAEFPPPFSELEVENFVLRVGRGRRGTRRVESPEMRAAKVFGGRLFDAIFQGEVRGCFRSSLDEARRQGAGLRCRLHLEATELVDLPWEYLYNPTLNRFLSLSVETPLVRYLDLPERIRPLAISPPLRVLVMISSPKDYPSLEVEREWARLKEAVGDLEERGLVMMERLPQAETTLAGLQRRLRQGAYHIFHFVGHGAFDERAQDGVLLLEDEEGHSRPVSGQYVGTLLHDERTLRLAILNACEGARTSRVDPFAGTAQSLVQQGIPAVIAMQFEISDEAAIVLAHEFYMALADGYPVDAALAEARKAIFAQGNDVEWGKPVLYLRAPDGRIFDIEPASDKERQRAEIATLYHEAQTAMAQEDWDAAIESLEAVLALDPALAKELYARYAQARELAETISALKADRLAEPYTALKAARALEGQERAARALEAARWQKEAEPAIQPPQEPAPAPLAPQMVQPSSSPIGRRRQVPVWAWIAGGVVGIVILLAILVGTGILSFGSTPEPPVAIVEATNSPNPTNTPAPTTTRTPRPANTSTPVDTLPSQPSDTSLPTITLTSHPTNTPEPAATTPVQPTNTPQPTPPPSRPAIVFSAIPTGRESEGGYFDIYTMDSRGRQRTRLVGYESSLHEAWPIWTYDKSAVIYCRGPIDNSFLWHMNADGSKRVPLYHKLDGRYPDISPNGKKIAFVSNKNGNKDIFISDLQGTHLVQLTNHPRDDAHPDWSPDGTQILFDTLRSGFWEIYVIGIDGSNPRNLTEKTGDTDPSWSPDGQHIAFVSFRDGNGEVYIMNADGSNQRNLTNNPASDVDVNWTPDGRILFASERDGDYEIYVMNQDGSGLVKLTDNTVDDRFPEWR